ncbi:MAG: cell division protein FtsZ [Flavobacteriaceae bacterium]|nr:cell division protein FtsZ [Flavobacteriaceae bacterium]
MDRENSTNFSFDLPKNKSNLIKVIGVGGGGSNAINYMFKQGINGVDFVVCNTDAQALNESPVPIKIQLGASLTEGLGAGANPDVGAEAAQESYEDIKSLLNTQTKMIFITAGMGGGTGTGAAPIIARMAKELDILTVGIVTMPFQFEGKIRIDQAQKGLEKIKSEVDSLVVINNNKLREVFGNLGFKAGFSKADEVLSKAARGIAEVITHHYTQNIDLKDAKTVLSNSGSAIMGSGTASGTNRAQEAIIKALDSPLLNDNKITGSKNVLLLIVSGSEEITIDEIGEINDYIQSEAGNNTNIIMGVGEDEELENEISVTIIATGFNIDQQNEIVNTETKKVIHTLEEDQKMEHILISNDEKKVLNSIDSSEELKYEISIENSTDNKRFNLLITDEIRDIDVIFEEVNYDNTITKDVMKTSELEFVTDDNIIDEFEGDFIINELSQEVQDIEVIEEELIDADKENQITFDFGIPNSRIESIDSKLTNLNNSDVDINKDEIFIDSDKSQFSELFNIEVNDPEVVNPKKTNEENPFDKTLSETASIENKKRMVQLKKFNYSFKNNLNKIDDLEKEPAYKRHGLKLDQEDNTSNETKLIIETDDNDEIQLKSNNSFLHDNVD